MEELKKKKRTKWICKAEKYNMWKQVEKKKSLDALDTRLDTAEEEVNELEEIEIETTKNKVQTGEKEKKDWIKLTVQRPVGQ